MNLFIFVWPPLINANVYTTNVIDFSSVYLLPTSYVLDLGYIFINLWFFFNQ
jgi:hypothetical protein